MGERLPHTDTAKGDIMLNQRTVIRSSVDDHVLFKIFKACYPNIMPVDQPYTEHHHSELELSVIESGSGCYTCAGVDYEFRPGDVFMHCGNDNHCFKRIDREEMLSLLVIQFEPKFVWTSGGDWFDSKYLQIFVGTDNEISRHISCKSQAAHQIRELLSASFEECRNHRPAYDMFVKANLLTILANLARYYDEDLKRKKFPVKMENIGHLEHSMNYILGHLEQELTLDELAKEAGMSRSYYSTMFKMLNGVSVWTYITNQRISKAQYMLEESDISILEISEKCGFGNISNFNRAFKKITGKTPREYRKGC